MSSVTSFLLVVACAALLNAGCEAVHHNKNGRRARDRRNFSDSSISLGSIKGTNMITLPKIHIGGPDNIIGFPDNCRRRGLELLGTELIVTNSDGGLPVTLVAENGNNALSNVVAHCEPEFWAFYRCPSGLDVVSYQYCGGLLQTTTAASTTASSAAVSTTTPSLTEPPSSSSSSSSSSEDIVEQLSV